MGSYGVRISILVSSFAVVPSLIGVGTFTAIQVAAPDEFAAFISFFRHCHIFLYCWTATAHASTVGVTICVRIASSARSAINAIW